MFYPKLFNDDFFDDFMGFGFPELRHADADRRPFAKHGNGLMKTDVRDKDGNYELDIELPGYKKDEITIELNNGYLTVSAAKGLDKDENDKKGKLIRQERYAGAMQRSFYVGENLTEEDIKAGFKHGVLSLQIPKKEAPQVPEKKTIMIEG